MQPDGDSNPGRDPFLEHLAGPLRYLRGLGVDGAMADLGDTAGGSEAPSRPDGSRGSASSEGRGSIVRQLERVLGRAPILDLPGSAGDPPTAFTLSDERYSIEGELGAGGMGRVLLVYDQDIRRRVAMKVLRDEIEDPKTVTRFIEEAQATGQLEHPNIAPVYDIGVDERDRVFFTMKLVRGRNLAEIIRDVSIGRLEVRRHFTLTRLVQILQQASMGVHYAHVRGVVHRDLKPDNVMVGDFGEVLVMDWGLAKVSGRLELDEARDLGVESWRADAGHATIHGTIQGTLAYMAPEQARGWQDEIDERTDVFGLGAILYEILTFRPPYEGRSAREVLDRASVGEIAPPGDRAPRNRIPESLATICRRALAAAKEDRYESAMAFHEALQVWLDGTAEAERQRQEAIHLVRQGKEKVSEFRRLTELERNLRDEAATALVEVEPYDPVSKKQVGWELEDEARRVRQRRIETFNEATSFLRSAIDVDAACGPAKEALATLYWDRFVEAEAVGNQDDMTMYRGLVERYHDGRFAAQLEGKGLVHVSSDPLGARVRIARIEERGRRNVEVDLRDCGVTPLELELPIGHHLLVLSREGFRDTRCPVLVERCGRHRVKGSLFREEEIGEGFVHVPAGEVLLGGDAGAPGALDATRRYVDDLFVGRYPVSFREYCAFLDELRASSHPELDERIPRTEKEGEVVLLGPDGRYRPDVDKIVESPTRDRYSPGFEWSLPVLAVTWFAARHYCEWLSRRTGRSVRLLRAAEWEKAARGVARSLHPWGDFFDWSFVKGGSSRAEPPQPEPSGVFEADESIYGVRDLAGSIREWCEEWFVDDIARLIRGGHWASVHEAAFRAAVRSGAKPTMRSSVVGFRVAAVPPRARA